MRKIVTMAALLVATLFASAQAQLDYKTIKDIVENEKQYYNDILNVYLNDDPYIRVDDYALVYYGQSFLPAYNGGNDKNEKALKNYAAEGKIKPSEIGAILAAGNRTAAGPTVPPGGLYMTHLWYDDGIEKFECGSDWTE